MESVSLCRNERTTISVSSLFSTTRRAPGGTSPVSTERGVKDGGLSGEKVIGTAARSGPLGKRSSRPGPWHGGISDDVGGNGATREEPDREARGDPLHNVGSSSSLVEASTKAVAARVISISAATIVATLDSAVGAELLATRVVRDGRASILSVERSLVVALIVDAFYNVDFTTNGPVVTVRPPSGPSSAASRNVISIHDDNAVDIELVLVVNTDGLAVSDIVVSIDAHDRSVSFKANESLLPSSIDILKVDIAVGRISEGPKVPSVKEASAIVDLLELPLAGKDLLGGACSFRCRASRSLNGRSGRVGADNGASD